MIGSANGSANDSPNGSANDSANDSSATPPSARPPVTKSPLVALAMSIGSWLVLPVVLAVGALLVAGRAERDRAAAAESSRVITTARMIAWMNLIVGGAVLAFVGGFVAAVLMGR